MLFPVSHTTRLVLAACACLSAQSALAETTLEPMVVTASRQASRVKETLADVTVISRDEIEAAGADSLPRLLARQPGIQMYNQGGMGKLSSIFVRGANANQTLVLIDGMRVGSVSAGTQTLEHIPLSQIERIEIVRGPASALYGSDAIGGVIQIFTRRGQRDTAADFAIEGGSYGARSLSGGISGGSEKLSWAMNAGYDANNGFSAFRDTNKSGYNEDNDPYERYNFGASSEYRFNGAHALGASFSHASGRNEYDGSGASFADFNEFSLANLGVYSRNQLTQKWLSNVKLGLSADEDRSFGSYSTQGSLFRTRQRQLSWQNDVELPLGTALIAAESLRQTVRSPSYLGARDARSLLLGWTASKAAHRWQLNARRDMIELTGNKTSATASYGYAFNDAWRASAAYGTAYRAPTFNDLFYPNYSNPSLKPERAINAEARLVWTGLSNDASITAYRNRVRDLIALDSSYIPQNLSRAVMTGVTMTWGTRWQAWQADVSVDWLKTRDLDSEQSLVRRAKWSGNLSVARDAGSWRTGASWGGVSHREDQYYDSSVFATRRTGLGGYSLFNVFADYRMNKHWTLTSRIDNLFDKRYESAYGYGTAGVAGYVGMKYKM